MASQHVKIFDTTLRDGLQSPNIRPVSLDQRIAIGMLLAQMGVDVVEAGFAIASDLDFRTIEGLAQKGLDSTICSLARTTKADIERAAEALKVARRGRIHTFISTSPLHMEKKLNKTPADVLQMTKDAITHARNLAEDVQFSLEDYTRTEPAFAYKVIEAAIACGATTINLPDTVGYATPDEYFELIEGVMHNVPNIDKATVSTHCHNDLGLAVANSLAGLRAGARQVECSVNGIGERAGNAAMEEIVMAIKVKPQCLPYEVATNTRLFMHASHLVQEVTGMQVQANKAIVGKNAFAHESGIHQHGMSKDRRTYEIMTPEDVGQEKSALTLGVTSGREGLRQKLEELGFTPSKSQLDALYLAFMAEAAKGRVADNTIKDLAQKICASA